MPKKERKNVQRCVQKNRERKCLKQSKIVLYEKNIVIRWDTIEKNKDKNERIKYFIKK